LTELTSASNDRTSESGNPSTLIIFMAFTPTESQPRQCSRRFSQYPYQRNWLRTLREIATTPHRYYRPTAQSPQGLPSAGKTTALTYPQSAAQHSVMRSPPATGRCTR
jgi:hypothetical protein